VALVLRAGLAVAVEVALSVAALLLHVVAPSGLVDSCTWLAGPLPWTFAVVVNGLFALVTEPSLRRPTILFAAVALGGTHFARFAAIGWSQSGNAFIAL
jgi:hypothetical protein